MNRRDILAGAGVGAALAFLLDPTGGARRRALVKNKLTRASRLTRDGLDATARDLGNRARGIAAATRGRLQRRPADDAVLVERVRARLGRACSHPRAIDVFARDGEITLRGPILADEVSRLLSVVAGTRGVLHVINQLEPHESGQGIPSLQGEGRTGQYGLDITQRRWAPATRALVSASVLGAGAFAYARTRRRAS